MCACVGRPAAAVELTHIHKHTRQPPFHRTSTLIPQRECEGIRSLLELVRLGEKQRRRPLMWPRPKGVLVREASLFLLKVS